MSSKSPNRRTLLLSGLATLATPTVLRAQDAFPLNEVPLTSTRTVRHNI